MLAAKQELVDAMKRGLVANTEQLQKVTDGDMSTRRDG